MKGISFFEQHVEKIVVGVAALGLVTVAGMELLSGRSVKSGSVELTPSNVNEVLDARAKAIEGGLSDGKRPHQARRQAAAAGGGGVHGTAGEAARQAAAPLPRIAPSLAGSLMDSDVLTDTWYYEPKLAAVRMGPDVMQTSDAIPASVLTDKEHEGLAAYFPDAGKRRGRGRHLADPLGHPGPEGPEGGAPSRRSGCEAAPRGRPNGVVQRRHLHRRRAVRAGGTPARRRWGKRTVVKPLPGHLTYRPRWGPRTSRSATR